MKGSQGRVREGQGRVVEESRLVRGQGRVREGSQECKGSGKGQGKVRGWSGKEGRVKRDQ